MSGEKRLILTFIVTLAILAAETIGGYLSNSLALLSDAGHIFMDLLAIGLSLVAARISKRPPDKRATFGYERVGLLAAFVNGLSLLVLAVLILYESYQRLLSPPEINISLMLPVAFLGLAGNLAMAFILGHRHEDFNIRAVWLHILGDTLSSVAVIISGTIIYFTKWIYADPISSLLIGSIIIWGGVRLVQDTLSIFLNLTPKGLNIEDLIKKIEEIPDVLGVHHIHLLPVAQKNIAFTAHILVKDKNLSEIEETKHAIEKMLQENAITHSTLQIESSSLNCDNNLFCTVSSTEDHKGHNHL